MNKQFMFIMLIIATSIAGCNGEADDYIPASSISKDGFARDGKDLCGLNGQEIKIWGFVDHGNMYGDEGAKQILGDWWSGDGPTATTWSFSLKSRENDEVGHSFSVRVPNDQGRDDLLKAFLADAKAQRPTKVFLKGKIFAFDAPTNFINFKGLYMKLQSSRDILLNLPGEKGG